MIRIIRFLILSAIKLYSTLFYKTINTGQVPSTIHWNDIRLILVLNHTSLFEYLYSTVLPYSFLWRFAGHGSFPVADKTLDKPIIGRLFKLLAPKVIRLTRKRDESWDFFLQEVEETTVIIFFPEGRMKRRDGLDKNGKPMSVRAGVVDLLTQVGHGGLLIVEAGGLHHLTKKGQILPRPFKEISLSLEETRIENYLGPFADLSPRDRRKAVVEEMNSRL